MKKGFTLAEVLVTLGIIGVVAAMTLPTLIQKHNNQVVETKLKKFYSEINQAVKMAEVEYGDMQYWWENLEGSLLENGQIVEGSSQAQKWFNKYLAKHLKIVKQEVLSSGTFIVYFADGGALEQMNNGTTRDWVFYTNPNKCELLLTSVNHRGNIGVCAFSFQFVPNGFGTFLYHYKKGFEPWMYTWDGNEETLKDGCYSGSNLHFCTALIRANNWTIPADYPYKVR